MSNVSFVHGKKRTRGELRLPQLHFIAVDDWMDKLGERAFCAWLRFYSWADRSNSERDFDNIPHSINTVVKRLGISKTTFYEKIVRPLWEYGFIDFHEYEKNNTTHLNIIVYEYPQNNPAMSTSPISKIRDYDTDYQSRAREIGKRGAAKSAELSKNQKGGVVQNLDQGEGGLKIEPPPVQKLDQGGPKNGPNNDPNKYNGSNNNNVLKIDQSVTSPNSSIFDIIQSEPRLTDRQDEILTIHSFVKNQPGYSDALFLLTLRKALDADIQTSFSNYFLKALLNNMNAFEQNAKHVRKSPLPKSVQDAIGEVAATSGDPVVTHEENVQKQLRLIELMYRLGELTEEEYAAEIQQITGYSSAFDTTT